MFGDCQVLSTLGNGGGSDSSSFYPSPLQNPNFGFMSLPFNIFPPLVPKEENGMGGKNREELLESGSGSEHVEGGGLSLSGNELEIEEPQQPNHPNKKKRYHRHTARQIQEMESLFKECPHPDDKQRLRLSQDLGLKPRQVKFWFQNRRTQMKAQQDRSDNVILRAENESLKNENYRLQSALRNIVCPTCGGPGMLGEMSFDEQQVRLENARLKEELERVCCMVTQYSGRAISPLVPGSLMGGPSTLDLDMNMFPPGKFDHHQDPMNCHHDMLVPMPFLSENPTFGDGSSILILDEERNLALDLAISAVDQLVKMCHSGEPLWVRSPGKDGGLEMLDAEEYARGFPWPVDMKQNPVEFRTEASRFDAVVIMNSITLVDAFLDAGKWMELFPSIVSRAKTLQVITSGASGHASGSLQLMYAELQVPSPLVPTREAHFLRYCHQNADAGSWVVVDFPLDGFQNSFTPSSIPYYKRRPSGCIIQDMPNGYSRVTWVEHVEVEEGPIHQIFNHLFSSGLAFGAKRWLAVLQRQCERLASLLARNISDLGVIPSPQARKNLMNLAQRMIRTFSVNISTSCAQTWTALSANLEDTVRVTTRKVSGDPGEPNGLILTAVSTTYLPYHYYQVFDLLRDERRRSQLEVLSNGNSLHEVAHIANGSHPGNCISLLRINVASNSSQRVELMLQESCTDDSGSLVVYTTVDVDAIQLAMNGEDPSCIPLLPMGFLIHPITGPNQARSSSSSPGSPGNEGGSTDQNGCLLTVGLQVLASTMPTAKPSLSSITAINHHIGTTVQQITVALAGNSLLPPPPPPPPAAASPPPPPADHDQSPSP